MSTQVCNFDNGTSLVVEYPWGLYRGGRALCPDGVVRALHRIALTADTCFSVPASVKLRGKTVAGFITLGKGSVEFIPYRYRKNGAIFDR